MTILQAYSGSSGFNLSSLLLLVLLALVVYAVVRYLKTIDTVTHQAQQPFEAVQFSAQEFYGLIENQIKEKNLPNIRMSRVYHSMHGTFSLKREYLRVQFQNYFFDICAAPFAKDFFVSYRQGELKVLVRRKREKTFYEEDTENMFHASVKLCYDRAIEWVMENKGMRQKISEQALLQ